MKKRKRMILDLPEETQMAIRLAAVKRSERTVDAVILAIEEAFPQECEEAREILNEGKTE